MKPPFAPALAGLLAFASFTLALGPNDVYLIVNKNVADSKAVAEHYCLRRGVPKANILTFDLPTGEDISRGAYETKLATPLRNLIKPYKSKVKVLVTTYGVPLRIGADSPTAAEAAELVKVKAQLAALYKTRTDLTTKITALTPQAAKDATLAAQLATLKSQLANTNATIRTLESKQRWLAHTQAVAALDSDLALLWAPTYELRQWTINPLYWRLPAATRAASTVVMTSRLDGPSLAIVKKIIDMAVATEATGLTGKAYFDAQGKVYDAKADPSGMGYNAFDESLREAAKLFTTPALPAVLDNKPALFTAGSCPSSAIYCGWYSHAKYIASNKFVAGAVGYHMASSEAVSLRNANATYWCKKMLDDGITATLGPVGEPYTLGFPKPAEFFGFLATGATLVESYWSSQRYGSWMMVLVGDPLYKPFAKAPKLTLNQIKISPIGSK